MVRFQENTLNDLEPDFGGISPSADHILIVLTSSLLHRLSSKKSTATGSGSGHISGNDLKPDIDCISVSADLVRFPNPLALPKASEAGNLTTADNETDLRG